MRVATLLALVFALSSITAGPAAADAPENLLANGSFDTDAKGWEPGSKEKSAAFDWQKNGGRASTGALHARVELKAPDGPWIWFGAVKNPPKDTALKISGWVRGKGIDILAAICVQGLHDHNQVAFATTEQSTALHGDFDWTHAETVLPATAKMDELAVLAFVAGRGEAWFDDLRVEKTDAAPPAAGPPTPQPGLLLVRGEFDVGVDADVAEPRALWPIPLSYREQVPLTYEVKTDPEGALASVAVREDRPGNFVIDAKFRAMKRDEHVRVSWSSLVICGERSFDGVPKTAPIPTAWPAEALPWLRSTRCVQSGDARIVAVAKELRAGTDDVREIIDRVEKRARHIFSEAQGHVTELTAVEALDKQGSCTSCANLVAALLRACGVPARVLSGYPLWSGSLQTHYIVEAFVPGYGWYPIEPTMTRSPCQPYEQIEVSIVPTEYEDASKPRPCAMGGVPYLSLTEIPVEHCFNVGGIAGADSCDHVAELWRALATSAASPDWALTLEVARGRWTRWLAKPGALDAHGCFATTLQPDDVKATNAAELGRLLAH